MWHRKEIAFRFRRDRQNRLCLLPIFVVAVAVVVNVGVVAFGAAFDAAAQVVSEVVLANNLDDLVPASLLHKCLQLQHLQEHLVASVVSIAALLRVSGCLQCSSSTVTLLKK